MNKNTYYIRGYFGYEGRYDWLKVKGKPIKNSYNLDLFYHRNISNNPEALRWTISEGITGYRIIDAHVLSECTEAEINRRLKKETNKTLEDVKIAVDEYLNDLKNQISPRHDAEYEQYLIEHNEITEYIY